MGSMPTEKRRALTVKLRAMTLHEREGKTDGWERQDWAKQTKPRKLLAPFANRERVRPATHTEESATVSEIKELMCGFPVSQQAMLLRLCQRLMGLA